MTEQVAPVAPEAVTPAPAAAAAPPPAAPVTPAAPEAAAPAAPAATLVSAEPEAKPVAAPADWPTDWKDKLASGDAKERARLERMGSPADIYKAYRALEAKMSSGQLKAAPKENATPEEMATWRKESGLPDKPEAYEPKLPNGMVLGDADKPLLAGFQKTAFESNLSPEQFNSALAWYYAEQDAAQAKMAEDDAANRTAAEDDLRKEWGADYRREVAGIKNFLATAPEGLADRLFAGRTADGRLIGDDPTVLRWLASLTREINPMASLVPAGSADAMKAGEARIKEIEGKMGTAEYWKDDALQAEYRNLVEARDRQIGRAAA